MRKRITLIMCIALVSLLSVPYVSAENLNGIISAENLNGTWNIISDTTLDASLDTNPSALTNCNLSLTASGATFSGSYVSCDSSKFEGVVYSGKTTSTPFIKLIQYRYNSPTTVYAVYIGTQVSANSYMGTWHDWAGRSGDFTLSK